MDEMETRAPDAVAEPVAEAAPAVEEISPEELLPESAAAAVVEPASAEAAFLAAIEAIIYVTEEPATPQQIAAALGRATEDVLKAIAALASEYDRPERGLAIRQVAGGYQMATKAEHHEAVRSFAKSLKPPLKLSLAALETLAVVAYKQPVTTPEIMEIRGVQGAGVLKTLLDRKLIMAAGRKNVIGKPVLYKTTKEFLVQFGLKDVSELPTLKEFEELRRMAIPDGEVPAEDQAPAGVETAGDPAAESPAEKAEPPAEPADPATPDA